LASLYSCPDCISEAAEPVCDEHGIWHVEVRHDPTCPWLNDQTGELR
jgi:hypothetical protein